MLPVPTRRLALAAALGALVVLALPVDRRLLLVDGLLLLAAVVDWLLAPRPDRVGVTRELPGVLALGGRGDVVWRLTNPLGRRVRVALADDLAPSLRAATRRVRVTMPARGRAEARAELHPARRGRFEPGFVTAQSPRLRKISRSCSVMCTQWKPPPP